MANRAACRGALCLAQVAEPDSVVADLCLEFVLHSVDAEIHASAVDASARTPVRSVSVALAAWFECSVCSCNRDVATAPVASRIGLRRSRWRRRPILEATGAEIGKTHI